MTLTLEQMYEMQKELDAKIIKEKGLEGQDLLQNTVLALQVEIGELANEWRGFKHWSNDREPRTAVQTECTTCEGSGDINWPSSRSFLLEGQEGLPYEKCSDCGGSGEGDPINLLLEEYVDCLHFFLSIARQLDLPAADLYAPGPDEIVKGSTAYVFTEILHHVGGVGLHKDPHIRKTSLRLGLWIFYSLGEQRLGFTFDQIAEAYAAKNAVNHQWQANGY
ncbi:dUTP diphosphatase [Paenibacillus lactis]|uniref:Dimeric dUTPase (All-alpha-NTP-PPase superfamily) n=1 Tax=Paenibacillus lactis TaxID=228574 RepID=A0ABS4F9S6_9BACL|nr:dUTP diphosphatase [Paenibacillus lactis]MBP1893007.1 dimeric dUTPase (all-alpha-NTP-PPase superfamily) [Paenibacillus lactis]HAF97524.1 dUTPase [Paenibacillus lactis]